MLILNFDVYTLLEQGSSVPSTPPKLYFSGTALG
jgi:hypothetical protein